jgi:branched-chain amino acid transport system substrate-binding protein
VFALFNVVGTTNNIAIRNFLGGLCVPDLFAATGSPLWGNPQYPFVLGTELVPYSLEIKALVDYLEAKKPTATIAAIYASDDFGDAYKVTLHQLIKGTKLRIVQEQSYNPNNPDTKSQVTSLASSNADVFLLGATLLGCPNSLTALRTTGWKPLVYMSGTCAAKTLIDLSGPGADGVVTAAPLLDPAAPTTVAMPFYKRYAAAIKPFGAQAAPPDSSIVAYGWTTAALMVELLHKSPKLDRYSVMQTARTFTATGLGFMLPGTTFSTSADDWYLGESYHLVQFSLAKKYFVPITSIVDENGKTASFTPASLING